MKTSHGVVPEMDGADTLWRACVSRTATYFASKGDGATPEMGGADTPVSVGRTSSGCSMPFAFGGSAGASSITRPHLKRLVRAPIVTIVLALALVPFVFFCIENSKEMHVRDGFITDVDGNLAATAQYVSYASLFDLPAFSVRTLSAVRQVNLRLSGTKEAVLTVTGVVKHTSCRAVTLYTPEGGEILVDGKTAVVLAKIRGRKHVLTPPGRRLDEPESPAPRLYTEKEFFAGDGVDSNRVQRHSRRLVAESDQGGWASLGILAAAAILEDCSMDNWQHEATSISGTVVMGEESVEMHVFYNRSEDRQSAVRVTYPDGRSILADYAVGFEFVYSALGELTECEAMSGTLLPADELKSLDTNAVDEGALLIVGEDADGVSFLVQVDSVLLDTRSQQLRRPPVEDCQALSKGRPGEGNASSLLRGGRSLAGACGEWYILSRAAYKNPRAVYTDDVVAMGWTEIEECAPAGSNAHARIWTRGGEVAVGFSGSDDGPDWFNNINLLEHGTGMHAGFVAYVEQLMTCIGEAIQLHGGQVHYYVGHSLGGAAATIYYELGGLQAPDAKVITYGAPKTHATGGCEIPGTRYAHASDPAASNFWGAMSNYHHKIQHAKIYQDGEAHRRRRRWSWRRRRNWQWDSDLAHGCSQESDAGFLLDTLYHFAITHNSYDYHGDQSC